MKTAAKPVLQVLGPTGADLVPRWGDALLGVTVTDKAGHESDECVIRVAWTPPWSTLPPPGGQYQVLAGWEGEGLTLLGVYTLQRVSRSGDPEKGEQIEITCRAADLADKMKATGSKHYDAESGHGTAGKIFEEGAKEGGMEALVDAEVAGIAVPYRMRWNQSVIDFLTELADDIGAVVKPQGGKLVVTKRGGGASGSGATLPPIRIAYEETYAYSADHEPRGDYKTVKSPWFDPEDGRIAEESFETSAKASTGGLVHPAPTKDEAQRQAGAAADAYQRSSATGSFEKRGDASAVAGAQVICTGFGEGIDEIDWRAATVTQEFDPGADGWVTTVETEVKEKKDGDEGASKTS